MFSLELQQCRLLLVLLQSHKGCSFHQVYMTDLLAPPRGQKQTAISFENRSLTNQENGTASEPLTRLRQVQVCVNGKTETK